LTEFSLVIVAAGSCDRSCHARLLPTHSFAGRRSHPWEALPHGGRCGFIWCEFLAVRATPSKASCWRLEAAASTVALELADTGGISSGTCAARIEQPFLNQIYKVSYKFSS